MTIDTAGPLPSTAGLRATGHRVTVVAVLTFLLCLSLVAPASPAYSAATPSPSPAPSAKKADPKATAKRIGFGVVPATADGLDLRAFFSYGLTPGAVAYDRVALVNYSTKSLELDVYATDALNPDAGGFALLAAVEKPVDLGSWVTVGDGTRTVTVPGRRKDGSPGRVILPVSVTVPADATPGDHAAGVVASLATLGQNPEGQNIQLEQRVAARVYVRVDGPLKPSLSITSLKADFVSGARPWQAGRVKVTYTVANTGNLRMGFDPSVSVAGPGGIGRRTVTDEPVAELLPGNSQTFHTTVAEVWPMVRLNVTASVTPVAAVAAEPPALGVVRETVQIWAFSLGVLLALLFLLLLLAYLVRRAVRRRRQAGTHVGRPEAGEPDQSEVSVGSSSR